MNKLNESVEKYMKESEKSLIFADLAVKMLCRMLKDKDDEIITNFLEHPINFIRLYEDKNNVNYRLKDEQIKQRIDCLFKNTSKEDFMIYSSLMEESEYHNNTFCPMILMSLSMWKSCTLSS